MPRDGSEQVSQTNAPELERCKVRLAEVWMLSDFVAGQCRQGLADLDIKAPGATEPMTPQALLDKLHGIEERVAAGTLAPGDCSFVEVVRDRMNALIAPANGLTVAYTTLVTGPYRSAEASRVSMAEQAYPNLERQAARHRRMQMAVVIFAVLITVFVAYESARVALGKALLQTLTDLQVTQTQLATETAKLEAKSGSTDASYRVCDRPLVAYARLNNIPVDDAVNRPRPRVLTYDTPEAADLCGRDLVLRAHLDTAHEDLRLYAADWRSVMWWRVPTLEERNKADSAPKEDVELRVAPVLLVWGNLLLPILFATIGSAIFVVLDNFRKVKASELDPRDHYLAPVRLVLGFVVGACIGLLFSATGPSTVMAPSTAATVISSLTLTASGVAFLVGFAVESVFTLLNALVTRVFTIDAAAK